jgi:hypothetical protein
MGSRYSQLSLSERHQIARWRDAKVPVLDMARRLCRHVSTIHRELRHSKMTALWQKSPPSIRGSGFRSETWRGGPCGWLARVADLLGTGLALANRDHSDLYI